MHEIRYAIETRAGTSEEPRGRGAMHKTFTKRKCKNGFLRVGWSWRVESHAERVHQLYKEVGQKNSRSILPDGSRVYACAALIAPANMRILKFGILPTNKTFNAN